MLDLNKPFTKENVAALLASKDDSRNCQLRVTSDGKAFISDDVGAKNISGLAFRLETFGAGNGYVGPKAARNEEFVARISKVLSENWPEPTSTYIDIF